MRPMKKTSAHLKTWVTAAISKGRRFKEATNKLVF